MVSAHVAGERWRNALAELEYAERHGSPAEEVAQLARGVIEARVAMFQAGVARARALPVHLRPTQLLPAHLLPSHGKVIALP